MSGTRVKAVLRLLSQEAGFLVDPGVKVNQGTRGVEKARAGGIGEQTSGTRCSPAGSRLCKCSSAPSLNHPGIRWTSPDSAKHLSLLPRLTCVKYFTPSVPTLSSSYFRQCMREPGAGSAGRHDHGRGAARVGGQHAQGPRGGRARRYRGIERKKYTQRKNL